MWFFKATIFGTLVVIISGGYIAERNCRPGLCDQLCVETDDGYDCRCGFGYYRNPSNTRRCLPASPACQPGYQPSRRDPRICEVITPVCQPGYQPSRRDPRICEAITPVCQPGYQPSRRDPRICEAINSDCQPGYQPSRNNPTICEDVDECQVPNPCEQLCINSIGNYRCGCRHGYYINAGNGRTCISMNMNGCAPGYAANPTNNSACTDIDECQRPGLCEHKCVNLQGSYRCSCYSGYQVSGTDNSRCRAIVPCSAAVDVIIVMDSTNSMGSNNFQFLLSFAAESVRHFEISNSRGRFGALLFSDTVQPLFGLNEYKTVESITEALLNAEYHGGVTVTNELFDYIRENDLFSTAAGGRSNAVNTLVMFTDGRSTAPDFTRAAAENLKNTGVRIITVGISNRVSESELASIASTPEDVILATDFEHLDYIQDELDRRICPGNDK